MSARSQLLQARALVVYAALLFAAPSAMGTDAIIIESAPDGYNSSSFKSEGIWLASTGKSKAPGLVGTSSVFNTADATEGVATFTPNIPVEGQYEVFVTFSQSANSKGVRYKIVHADGETTLQKDQDGLSKTNERPNTWISLGTYKFAAGSEGRIEIADPATGEPANSIEPNIRVYADAIKLVPVGFSLPESYQNVLPQGVTTRAATAPAPAARPATPTATTPSVPPSLAPVTAPAALPTMSPNTEPGLNQPISDNGGTPPVLPGLDEMNPAQATPPPTPQAAPVSVPPALTQASNPAPVPATLPGVSNPAPGLGLPANLPSLSAASTPSAPSSTERPSVSASLPPSLADFSASQQAPASSGSVLPTLNLAPADASVSLPGLAAAGFSNSTLDGASRPAVSPRVTPALTPPPTEDDGTGIQWAFDYYATLGAARQQKKMVLVFFTAKGNRVANRYLSEYFKDPVVRSAMERFMLVKLDFPMNTRLAYRLGVFGAGQIAVVTGDDTKVGAILQIPSSPAEFANALDAMK